jgi:hypothetical protein
MMYTGREDRRGTDDRRAEPRGERAFGRRIDCAEDGRQDARGAAPARGGGVRDPEAWEARSRASQR